MLKKGLEALQIVALREELSAREIATAMNLPKSTAHRLVARLVKERLLLATRRPEGDVYCLGPLIHELSGAAFMWRPLVQHARPVLTAVRDDTGETVGIHMLYGDRRVLLDQIVSHQSLRWVYGHHMSPMPLRAGATGKMFLAMLGPKEFEAFLGRSRDEQKTAGKTVDDTELRARVAEIRKLGHSISHGELNPGITSISVPLLMDSQTSGMPRAAISLAAPSVRVTPEACATYVARLQAAAKAVVERIQQAG